MKFQATTAVIALMGVASARDVSLYSGKMKREVPQEHSHEAILQKANTALKQNNPLNIQDAVFALLGNAAAAAGAPSVSNLDCLQQIVADQAFTNAKAAGDVDLMANAIMFRALERNTGKVGLASVICNETATNPEIAAITQHQDPASPEASGNKAIALAVAKQLAGVGADPNLAIQTGTFAPGNLDDATAKGNTCDDANDATGCIISQNLLVPDVTQDEIAAAVGSAGGAATASGSAVATATATATAAGSVSNATATSAAGDASSGSGCSVPATAPQASSGASTSASGASTSASGTSTSTSGVNVQSFTGTLGGAAPAVISSTADPKRPFSVNGATFVNAGAALQRSCSVQHNACADAANSGSIDASVSDCETQEQACNAAATQTKKIRKLRRAALDFGSCSDPSVKFAAGLDGRNEESFAPNNEADFNHGSALNIKVVSDFICQRLASSCGAAQATVDTCQSASQAAAAEQGQAAADTFNCALGV